MGREQPGAYGFARPSSIDENGRQATGPGRAGEGRVEARVARDEYDRRRRLSLCCVGRMTTMRLNPRAGAPLNVTLASGRVLPSLYAAPWLISLAAGPALARITVLRNVPPSFTFSLDYSDDGAWHRSQIVHSNDRAMAVFNQALDEQDDPIEWDCEDLNGALDVAIHRELVRSRGERFLEEGWICAAAIVLLIVCAAFWIGSHWR